MAIVCFFFLQSPIFNLQFSISKFQFPISNQSHVISLTPQKSLFIFSKASFSLLHRLKGETSTNFIVVFVIAQIASLYEGQKQTRAESTAELKMFFSSIIYGLFSCHYVEFCSTRDVSTFFFILTIN